MSVDTLDESLLLVPLLLLGDLRQRVLGLSTGGDEDVLVEPEARGKYRHGDLLTQILSGSSTIDGLDFVGEVLSEGL